MNNSRSIRLLVVEDSEPYLYLIQNAFSERKGSVQWDLTIAKDGEQAVQLLFQEEENHTPLPDIILLDWNLPALSGNQVLRLIKEHPKLRRIPVLVFSSSEADSDIEAAYGDHANGYITKPGSGTLLAEVVEAIETFWISIAQLSEVKRTRRA